jgi:hypothetical protein
VSTSAGGSSTAVYVSGDGYDAGANVFLQGVTGNSGRNVVFIDGSHVLNDVTQHLCVAHSLLAAPGDHILLDDVDSDAYPEVQMAQTQFLSDQAEVVLRWNPRHAVATHAAHAALL